MLGRFLAAQLHDAGAVYRLHLSWMAAVAIYAAGALVIQPRNSTQLIVAVSWLQFILGALIGGALTGWRVTQFPKTRAAEFHLVMPVSDWVLVGSELLGGMLRSAFIVGAWSPLVLGMWGAGWIGPAQVVGLIAVPILFGWMVGIGLANIAFTSQRVRRILEWVTLLFLFVYLIFLGLLAEWTIPRLLAFQHELAMLELDTIWLEQLVNPIRLIGTLYRDSEDLWARVLGVSVFLLSLCALGAARLVWRLRGHYLEENYGSHYDKKEFNKPIADEPLAWWTVRRVSRFKGRVNIYLGWGTVLLYSGWLLLGNAWPDWLGGNFLRVMRVFGGQAIIGAFAVQFGLVATAFLYGLWDSSARQRVGRLEVLLITPLSARDYAVAGAAAAWTRGRQYFYMALVVWCAAAAAGRISWGAVALAIFCTAAYALLFFAIAFRNFARVKTERAAGFWGLGLSVGLFFASFVIFFRWPVVGAMLPLGSLYTLTSPITRAQVWTDLPWPALWSLIGLVHAAYAIGGVVLLRDAMKTFDRDLRDWFSYHHTSPGVRGSIKRAKGPIAAPTPALE
ncbi:MAG TPA: hypothetical protein VGE52_13925 [Pirellulales bacterium]